MDRKAKLEELKSYLYTHRGFHDKPAIPENSMAAFRRTKERGWGSEMDIHLMKDGNLGIAHDSNLKRVTGADVRIEDLTKEDLENYRLEGTDERIPLFEELLESFDPRAVLWFTKNHPEVIRGQLAQDYSTEAQVHVSGLMKTMLRDLWFNPLTKPDFVAYRFSDRHNKHLQRYIKRGGQEVSWIIRTKEDFDKAVKEGSIPIFELFDPEQ